MEKKNMYPLIFYPWASCHIKEQSLADEIESVINPVTLYFIFVSAHKFLR